MSQNNMPILDFNQICRLCLMERSSMTNIFSKRPGDVSLSLKFMSCTSIEISTTDSLPNKICNYCLFQVDAWYKFKDLCENSENTVQKLVNSDSVDYQAIAKVHEMARELMQLFKNQVADPVIKDDGEEFRADINDANKPKFGFSECDRCFKYFAENAMSSHRINCKKFKRQKRKSQVLPKNKKQTRIKIIDVAKTLGEITESIVCNVCSAEFISKSELRNHVMVEHIGDTEKYKKPEEASQHETFPEISLFLDEDDDSDETFCNECGIGFPNESELLVHKFTDHITKKKKTESQQCPDCMSLFKNSKELYLHISEHHGYRCPDCNDGFATKEEMQQHQVEKGDHKMRFHCVDCNMVFEEKIQLMEHLKEKKECSICEKVILKPQRLKEHMLHKHNQGLRRLYQCEICGKEFPYATSLKYHYRIHGEKNIFCSICGKSFHFQCNYNTHMDLHHSKAEDKIVCELCGGLYPKCKIRDHLLRHSNPSFQCHLCHKKYRLKSQLHKHFTKNHKKKEVENVYVEVDGFIELKAETL